MGAPGRAGGDDPHPQTGHRLVGGTDAHAKNYSLLLSGSQVRLAPLYDLASALPYGTHEKKLRLAMRFGGDDRPTGVTARTWDRLAADLGVGRDWLVGRAGRLCDAVPVAFAGAAGELDGLGTDLPARLVEAVTAGRPAAPPRCPDRVRRGR